MFRTTASTMRGDDDFDADIDDIEYYDLLHLDKEDVRMVCSKFTRLN